MSERLEIRFPGRLSYLPAIRELVTEALAAEEAEGADDILLVVQEACVNAVRHGTGGDGSRPVRVAIVVERDRVELTVSDRGAGFVLPRVPDALSNDTAESGRGLAIIQAIMDEVTVESRDGMTTLCLVKRRRAS